jgi:hypothetical protein
MFAHKATWVPLVLLARFCVNAQALNSPVIFYNITQKSLRSRRTRRQEIPGWLVLKTKSHQADAYKPCARQLLEKSHFSLEHFAHISLCQDNPELGWQGHQSLKSVHRRPNT